MWFEVVQMHFLYKSQVIVSVSVVVFAIYLVHCAWCWTRPCSMFVLIDFCSAANRAHQRTNTTRHPILVWKVPIEVNPFIILSNCLIFIVFFHFVHFIVFIELIWMTIHMLVSIQLRSFICFCSVYASTC